MDKKKNLTVLLSAFLLLSCIVLFSCKKEENAKKYELRFTSISSNPYLIEVAGNSDIIPGNTYKVYNLEKGTYAWKVTQQSGYILYPTVVDGTVNLDQDKEIIFP